MRRSIVGRRLVRGSYVEPTGQEQRPPVFGAGGGASVPNRRRWPARRVNALENGNPLEHRNPSNYAALSGIGASPGLRPCRWRGVRAGSERTGNETGETKLLRRKSKGP